MAEQSVYIVGAYHFAHCVHYENDDAQRSIACYLVFVQPVCHAALEMFDRFEETVDCD